MDDLALRRELLMQLGELTQARNIAGGEGGPPGASRPPELLP
ncbi:hypothetical protein [Streptomyces cavernicola]|uniref:Uncharacterized protein n=1 Tax=Streptomyces cavernicola TaxID=3043613 RepID=A0ABT6SGD2_9ACTN|nr:hypothetical protein [Streptomyces sp. B-S-A6]MDI3406959.1 hypothetical protein [Streptomyces sp. B-S-A6]